MKELMNCTDSKSEIDGNCEIISRKSIRLNKDYNDTGMVLLINNFNILKNQ